MVAAIFSGFQERPPKVHDQADAGAASPPKAVQDTSDLIIPGLLRSRGCHAAPGQPQ